MLRALFVDMDAYFASCEQFDRPELRGRPVAILPVVTDRTCCIATSYEAKKFGVSTGCPVRQARRRCPGLVLVEARPRRYIELHHLIREAAETVLPIHHVHSIDEFECRLMGPECEPAEAVRLARKMKAAIYTRLGPPLRCSVGIGPNGWLAKVATEMDKPDGLKMIQVHQLPRILEKLELEALPGIGPRMGRRLRRAGVQSVRHLCALSQAELARLWGSRIHGYRWYARLRGEPVEEPPTQRRSLGHSRVLAPELRHEAGARAIGVALLFKASMRLRAWHYWAYRLVVRVDHLDGPPWKAQRTLPGVQDIHELTRVFAELWPGRPGLTPIRVGVVLGDLRPESATPPPLYLQQRKETALSRAVDEINRRLGRIAVCPASMQPVLKYEVTRIAFTHIPQLCLTGTNDRSTTLRRKRKGAPSNTRGTSAAET